MIGGHGHVVPRVDGFRARCGGPMLCKECAGELSDHTQRLNMLVELYRIGFSAMVEKWPETAENGTAHASGLMACYMRGLKDGADAK